MNEIIYAPEALYPDREKDKIDKAVKTTIFLGGTIDMGNSVDWQQSITDVIFSRFDNIILYNPRRKDWDLNWNSIPENLHFKQQVEWELEAQQKANFIIYYFAPESKSPVTMLELGLFHSRQCIIYCPRTCYRYGNVKIVSDHFCNPCYDNENDFIDKVLQKIRTKQETDKEYHEQGYIKRIKN